MEKKTINSKVRHKRRQPWIIRRIRLIVSQLIRLRATPQVIARGLSVGVFAGFFPFFGLQTVLGIFLAAIVRGSKIAAAAGTWISNPLTYVPIYVFNYQIGKLILGTKDTVELPLEIESFRSFRELGFTFGATLITGCLVVGAIAALLTYIISLPIFKRLRQKQKKRRRSRKPNKRF